MNAKNIHEEQKETNSMRIFLYAATVAYSFFGYLNTYVNHYENTQHFLERVYISFACLVLASLSFRIPFFKRNLIKSLYTMIYIAFAHHAYMGAMDGFSFNLTIDALLVLLCSSIIIKNLSQLRIYFAFVSISIGIASIVAPHSQIDNLTLFFAFICFITFLYIGLELGIKSKKIIQDNEANLSVLLENTEEIIWSLDQNYKFIEFNKSFENFVFEITQEYPSKNKPINQSKFDKLFLKKLNGSYIKAFQGESIQFEQEIKLSDEVKTYSFLIKPIYLNSTNIIGLTVFGNDITTIIQQKQELIRAKEFAEHLAIAKEHFLASMSHEIRTPLNGILGFTKVLLQNKSLTEEQKKQLNAIKSSGDILLVIINDILDLSKIEAGKMNLESKEIDIYSIVKQSIDTFEVKISEKKLIVNLICENKNHRLLLGDPVRISQILLNIISNSIKFTPEKGLITLKVDFIDHFSESTLVRFEIEDTGIGIPKNKLDSVFEPFVQTSDDTARKYGGTGLGLSIVKKIVGLMDGTIEVVSDIGQGTKFVIELNLTNSLNNSKPKQLENSNDFRKVITSEINVLLAEDNLINQLLAQTVLGQFGFKVTTVENGKEAFEAVQKNQFDIILMDLMMPEMDGYDATIAIRNLPNQTKNIPIMALTADVTAIDVEKCKTTGMNDYISKPFEPEDLLKKIINLVNHNKNN